MDEVNCSPKQAARSIQQQATCLNEEQINFEDLLRISDGLRKTIADILVLLKDKQSYKEIENKNSDTIDFIREKFIHSDLNKQFTSKVNLNSAKYVATCGMFTKKINEIQKVKQNLRDQNSNDLQLSLQNWKDVYDAFKSLVVLEQDISFGTVPPQITVSSLATLAEYDIQKMEQSHETVKSFHKSIFGQTSVPKQRKTVVAINNPRILRI